MLQKFITCLRNSASDTNEHEHLATTLQQELNELDPNESNDLYACLYFFCHSTTYSMGNTC